MNNVSRIENANRYDIKRVSPSREHGALWVSAVRASETEKGF